VDDSIIEVQQEHPEIFSGNHVDDREAYFAFVIEKLNAKGYCAVRGGPVDEVGVKRSNDYSEQFDILLGSGHVRFGAFTVRCEPARF
jgi:hypothetical protein